MNRVQGVLGLARRAGAIAYGTYSVLEAVRSNKALLILFANDASENTKKQLLDKASYRNVPTEMLPFGTEELGQCIGKGSTAAIALMQSGFVIAYQKACAEEKEG